MSQKTGYVITFFAARGQNQNKYLYLESNGSMSNPHAHYKPSSIPSDSNDYTFHYKPLSFQSDGGIDFWLLLFVSSLFF